MKREQREEKKNDNIPNIGNVKPSNDIPIHFSLKIKYNFFNLAEKLNRSFCKANYANKCAQRCNW